MSSDEENDDAPKQFTLPRRIMQPRRRLNLTSSTALSPGAAAASQATLVSPDAPGFGTWHFGEQATAFGTPMTTPTTSSGMATGASETQPLREPASSAEASDGKTSEPQDNRPVFLPRAPAPDPEFMAAVAERRRAANERDGGTLGPTDKETDIYDLQRQIDTMNKLRGPGNEVSDEERRAMEEKLVKLRQGQWYNKVLQQARDRGEDTVGLEHFRRLIAEMDQVPVKSLREFLKLGPTEQVARLEGELAVKDQIIKDSGGTGNDKQKWHEEEDKLKGEIDRLRAETTAKDSKITELEEQLAVDGRTIQHMQSKGTGIGKAKRLSILSVEKEKLQVQLDTANNALEDALEKLKQKDLDIKWKEEQIELRDAQIAELETQATEAVIPGFHQQLGEKDRVIQGLQAQLEQKTHEVDQKAEVVKTRNETISDLKKTINSKRQEIKRKEEESVQKDHQIAELTKRLEEARVTNAVELKKTEHGAQDQGDVLQQRTAKAQGTQTHADARLVHGPQDEEIERLQAALQQCQEHSRRLQDDLDRLFMAPMESSVGDAAQPAAEDKKISVLTGIIEWSKARIKELKPQIASLEADKESLALRLQEAQEQLTAQARAQTPKDAVSDGNPTSSLEHELAQCRKAVQDLTAENNNLAEKSQKLELDLRAACPRSELELCQKRVAELESDVRKLKAGGNQLAKKYKEKIAGLVEEKNGLSAQLEAAQKQATEIGDNKDARIEQLKDQLDKMKKERDEFASNLEYIRDRLEKAKAEQDARVGQIDELQEQNVEINAIFEQAQKDRDSANAELALAKSELERVKGDLDSASHEKQTLEADSEHRIKNLEADIDALKEQLNNANLRAEQLETDLGRCEAHRQELQDTEDRRSSDESHAIKGLRDLVEQLEGKLAEAEEAHNVCEAARKKLQSELTIAKELGESRGIEGLPSTDQATSPLQAINDDLRRQLKECKECCQHERSTASEASVAEGGVPDNKPEIEDLRHQVQELESKLAACDEHCKRLEEAKAQQMPDISRTDNPDPATQNRLTPADQENGDGEGDGEAVLQCTGGESTGASDRPETKRPATPIPPSSPASDDTDTGNKKEPTSQNRGTGSSGRLWLVVLLAVLGIATLVWSGWCSGQILKTGYGYYYYGGFNGNQFDVSFTWWQFCCLSGLTGFVAVVLAAQAWREAVFQGFVAALATALADEVIATRRRARRARAGDTWHRGRDLPS